jgi:hypothetical protein
MPRYNLQDCEEYAKSNGGLCLSLEYKSTTTKMDWECEEKHKWETTFKIIKTGCWCPDCSKIISGKKRKGTKNNKITIQYCKTLAIEKGGECLSEVYKSKQQLLWKCENGHTFPNRVDCVQKGRWCNECYLLKVKPTIEKFKKYAISKGGECLSDKYIDSQTNLEWKCNRNHQWESKPRTDFWCRECSIIDSYKITVEDLQHFACSNEGECLSKEYKSQIPIKWKCKRNHQWESIFSSSTGWCRLCINIEQTKYNINDCNKSAEIKGGKCLSKEYINVDTSMYWECKQGHKFKTRYGHILEGSWCKSCWGLNKRLGLLECISWAKKLGGECLSEEYEGIHIKMLWKCKESHKWIATFGSLRNMKSWCPTCSKRYSKAQIQWLNYVSISINENIQHAETIEGEYNIPDTKYYADGYEKTTRTILEYHGSYWHGDIRVYNPTDINKKVGKTYGQLLKNTLKKELIIRNLGYNYICMWEYDWMKGVKAVIKLQKLFRCR